MTEQQRTQQRSVWLDFLAVFAATLLGVLVLILLIWKDL